MTQHMNDDDLDRLLDSTAATISVGAAGAATELVTAARDATEFHQPRHGTSTRRRSLLAAIAGVALLCGAGTTAAYQLSIPPFQTVPDDLTRVRPPIVVEFDAGPVVGGRSRCLVFPEFFGLSARQASAAGAWSEEQDWSGYGDRLAAQAPGSSSGTGEGAVEDYVIGRVERDLRLELASQMVPGVELDSRRGLETGRPTLTGYAVTCEQVGDEQ